MSKSPENTVKRYGINAVSSVLTQILRLTVLVWVNQYLLRRIEPEEYSLFPLVVSLVIFADLFKNIFTGGVARYIVEADSRGDDKGVTRIVSSMFPVLVVVAVFLAVIGGAAVWRIDSLITVDPAYLRDARLMLLLLVFSLCLGVLATPFSVGLYARQRFVALNVVELGCEALRIAILLSLLLGVSTRVIWLVVASTSSVLVSLAIQVIVTRRILPAIKFRRELASLKTARTLLGFGAWTSVQGLTELVSRTVPLLILNHFATALDVAAFHLGRLPDIQLRSMIGAATRPAQPALISIYARDGADSLHDLYFRGGRYHLWIALVVAAPLLVFGKEIIGLYVGSEYAAAASVIFAFLAVYPFLWASAMFFQVAHAVGRIGAYYICDIVVQVVSVGAMFYAVAIRGLGAPGAAIAINSATAALHVLLIWPMGLRLVRGRWGRFFRQTVFPGVFPFVAALGACHVFGANVRMDSWFMVGLGCAVSLCVYLAILYAFCLDTFDRSLVARLARRSGKVLSQAIKSVPYRQV